MSTVGTTEIRKRELLEMGKRWMLQYGRPFDQPASYYPDNVPPPKHDSISLTLALLNLGSNAEFARGMTLLLEIGPKNNQYGIFQGPDLLEIWLRYSNIMPEATKLHVRQQVEAISLPNDRHWSVALSTAGGNWGFCAAATLGLAGEVLQDNARLARGKESLKLALDQLRTTGTIQEYNSPSYYTIDLRALSLAARYGTDREFRGMARTILTILFAQTLCLYHPPTTQVSGPWQRSYHWDTYGGPSPIKAWIYPYIDNPPFMDTKHLWEFPAMVGSTCSAFLSSGGADVVWQDWLSLLLTDRPAEWRVHLTNQVPEVKETRGLGTIYPSIPVHAEVYQTPVYTFGSASYVYHNGAQAETVYLAWSLRSPVTALSHFKTGTFRMLHHDVLIEGGDNESVFGKTSAGHVLYNEGRTFAYQQDKRAIVFSHPDRIVPETSRLGLSFFATELEKPVDEIWCGRQRITTLPFAKATADWVVIRDGRFYLALRPLPGNENLGTPDAIQVRRTSTKYLQVSFLNYAGVRKSMTDWIYTRNGVFIETADTTQFPNTQDFLSHIEKISVTETVNGSQRHVSVSTPDGILKASYDNRAEQFLTRTWKGVPYTPAAFQSPRCVLATTGAASVGNISVVCNPPQPLFFAVDAQEDCVVLLNYGTLTTKAVVTLPTVPSRTVCLLPYEEQTISAR